MLLFISDINIKGKRPLNLNPNLSFYPKQHKETCGIKTVREIFYMSSERPVFISFSARAVLSSSFLLSFLIKSTERFNSFTFFSALTNFACNRYCSCKHELNALLDYENMTYLSMCIKSRRWVLSCSCVPHAN